MADGTRAACATETFSFTPPTLFMCSIELIAENIHRTVKVDYIVSRQRQADSDAALSVTVSRDSSNDLLVYRKSYRSGLVSPVLERSLLNRVAFNLFHLNLSLFIFEKKSV